jgi:hypothetical protein|tara:strand:+ start:197 stop:619 length:423 start_codon:yes stop_codon:yes gene_type:complete
MSYVTSIIPAMNKPHFKTIPCSKCEGDMPELRLTEYGYDFCVKCSESGNYVKKKQAINVMMGEGDHTWIETIIMTAEQYDQYLSDTGQLVTDDINPMLDNDSPKSKSDKSVEILDFDVEDENEANQKDIKRSLIDGIELE